MRLKSCVVTPMCVWDDACRPRGDLHSVRLVTDGIRGARHVWSHSVGWTGLVREGMARHMGGEYRRQERATGVNRLRVLILGSTGSIAPRRSESSPPIQTASRSRAGRRWRQRDLLDRQRTQTGVNQRRGRRPGGAARIGNVTYGGPDAVTRLVEETEADVVLNVVVGALGLRPTLAALRSGARLRCQQESLSRVVRWCSRRRTGTIVPATPSTPDGACCEAATPESGQNRADDRVTVPGLARDLEQRHSRTGRCPPTWSMGR